jgi:Rrf2 family protein
MNISKKTTYGMCFMLRLALSHGDNYIKLKDIAKSENIPVKYLENIVSIIKPSDLIHVRRGVEGGYKLSRPPGQIKLAEIFEVLDGTILKQEPSDERNISETPNKLVVIDLWKELRLKLTELLECKTLEDLANDFKKKHEDQMFFVL